MIVQSEMILKKTKATAVCLRTTERYEKGGMKVIGGKDSNNAGFRTYSL